MPRKTLQPPLVQPGLGVVRLVQSATAEMHHGSMADVTFFVDMIAADPPWRQGNLTFWSNKAGVSQQWLDFVRGMSRHFVADVVYLKVGVPESAQWIESLLAAGMRRCIWWETRYAGGRNAQIVAARSMDLTELTMEEESRSATTAIAKWAYGKGVRTVADPCTGNGLMLGKFLAAGMRVTGTELVEDRALRAAKRLCGE